MSGTGIALNYYGKYLNWSLTYVKALKSPQYLLTRDGIKKKIIVCIGELGEGFNKIWY